MSDDTMQPRGRKKGRPKLVLMSEAGEGQSSRDADSRLCVPAQSSHLLNLFLQDPGSLGAREALLQRQKPTIARGLEPVGYNAERFVLDTLQYYDSQLCTDMVLVDAPDNPYRIPVELWRDVPDLLMDPIIAASTVHKLVRIQSSTGQLTYSPHSNLKFTPNHLHHMKHPLLEEVFTRQHKQTKALAEMMAEPTLHFNRALLGAVTTMILCDVQQSAFGDWAKHFKGAQAIVAARGGFGQLAKEIADGVNYELSIVMLVDLMRDAGSPSSLLSTESKPLQYLDHVETIYQEGAASISQCSNELLKALILINDGRHKLAREARRAATALDEHMSVLRDIMSFSASNWTTKQYQTPRPGWRFTEAFASADYTEQMLEDWARSFQAAVFLYGLRTLLLDQGIYTVPNSAWGPLKRSSMAPDEPVLVKEVEKIALDELIGTLRKIWATECKAPAWFGKFTLWPLFVAGMSVSHDEELDDAKNFICGSLSRICFHLGNFTPRDAIWAIQQSWEKASRVERGAWLEDLPQGPLPGLFLG